MLLILAIGLLTLGTISAVAAQDSFKLAAPSGWGGETIKLPPGFAPDMKLKGSEHIRFAPGMMNPASESFFSYAFAFELESKPELSDTVVRAEFLKYYRGLCKAVLNGKLPDTDFGAFMLKLEQAKSNAKTSTDDASFDAMKSYTGTLNWVEPFATKKPQLLHLELQTWTRNDRNYIFACVSPQPKDHAIWQQLRKIRNDHLKK